MAETDLVRKVKTALDRLLPPKIGSDGRLMEWVSILVPKNIFAFSGSMKTSDLYLQA